MCKVGSLGVLCSRNSTGTCVYTLSFMSHNVYYDSSIVMHRALSCSFDFNDVSDRSTQLVKQREAERKRAIAEGKMDDPLVPKRLDEAITMVGTCMDMCPRFERYRRERENNLDKWEVVRV